MLARKGNLKHDNETTTTDNTGFATIQQISLNESISKNGNVFKYMRFNINELNQYLHNSFSDWSDDDLTAQAMAFLVAGFDTSSSLLCFIAYELSLNSEIQERLQNEIDDVLSKSTENVSYNDLMAMKYLDMVVSGKALLYHVSIKVLTYILTFESIKFNVQKH